MERFKVVYKTEEKVDKIRILGDEFVINNSNKVKIIFNNKKYLLKEYLPIDIEKELKKKEYIKLGLILLENINNKISMFKNCESLVEFSRCKNDLNFQELDALTINEEKYKYKHNRNRDEFYYDFFSNTASSKKSILLLVKIIQIVQ